MRSKNNAQHAWPFVCIVLSWGFGRGPFIACCAEGLLCGALEKKYSETFVWVLTYSYTCQVLRFLSLKQSSKKIPNIHHETHLGKGNAAKGTPFGVFFMFAHYKSLTFLFYCC